MREEQDFNESIEFYSTNYYIGIKTWENSFNHLKLEIKGFPNTSYEGGRFIFELKLPNNFPFSPPMVCCNTIIWHPHIDSAIPPGKQNISGILIINPMLMGKFNANTGENGWTPSKTLKDVIEALIGIMKFESPYFKPSSALNHEAGEQFMHELEEFKTKASKWTEKYAQMND